MSKPDTTEVDGIDLQVGDIVHMWYGRVRLEEIKPYDGVHVALWGGKARIASKVTNLDGKSPLAFTIEPQMSYTVEKK